MSAVAPTLQAFFTGRLTQPAPGQRPHHRRLPRHLAAAARLRRHAGPDPLPAIRRPGRAGDQRVPRPLEHDRGNSIRTRNARLAAIHSLSPSRPCATLNTPTTSPACWPSRPSARPGPRHLPHRPPRPTRCWPPRPRPAPAAATTPAIHWPSITGLRASELTARPAATFTSAAAPTSPATAKAANSASPRSPPAAATTCAPGSPNAQAYPGQIRCRPRPGRPASAATPLQRRLAVYASQPQPPARH